MTAMELADGVGLPQIGLGSGWAAFLLVMFFIVRGKLIPRQTHDDVIHDRDEWRAESRIKDAQLAEKDRQLGHMGEVGRTVDSIMRAIQQGATRSEETP